MKANTKILIGLVGLWCVMTVYAQTTQTVPPPVMTEMQNLNADMKQMKSAGKFDNAKTIADLQSVMVAVQSNLQSAPQPIKDKMTQIVASVDKAKTSKADEKQVKELVQSVIHFVEEQFPGVRTNNNSTSTATTKTN